MELKASSRQLAGGAHGTFHVVGAGRICQPPALHKPLVPPARGFLPSASGPGDGRKGSWGGAGSLCQTPSSRGKQLHERAIRVAVRLPCSEKHLCWARGCIGHLVGQCCLVPSPSVEEMKGVEIKYSARSRSVE